MDEEKQLRLKSVELTVKLFEGKNLVKKEFEDIYVNIFKFLKDGKEANDKRQ